MKRTTRHGDTPQIDTHSRRRVSLVDYEYADLIDNQDKIRTLIDPTSSYALAAAYALGRAQDDEIIAAQVVQRLLVLVVHLLFYLQRKKSLKHLLVV